MPGHEVQKVVDVHLVGLVGLAELLEVHILLALLEDICEGEVLDEEVVEAVLLGQLQLLVDVLRQSPEDPFEVLDAHHLVLVVDNEKLEICEKMPYQKPYLDNELDDVDQGGVPGDQDLLEA